ncbi:DUF3826 domain-containing protein [Wenyingzhuangia sp. chi5]|uniref:DUF3826 domain-containing protein n=1 Tax=Wenyingzhuangia gilva TaxID=3057677 RepID=A0ABT8VTK1_9FLAO|nr:DUF3826 domain-containing protein [Wenyingzhuangia sp. chi5]MDO3695296.1 DUF3826 domain-containing protein [Wenyingzhuangia sp. chi5]
MKKFKNIITVILFVFAGVQVSLAQKVDPEYVKVTNERAQKIVDHMSLNNSEKELEVRDLIANQYRELNNIHETRDSKIHKIKVANYNKAKTTKIIDKIKSKADKKIKKLHDSYLKKLNKVLTDEQVDQVKDGMTYGVLPKTYTAFLEMIPSLTVEEKEYIYNNLKEAREFAMDGGSSKEKHAWFGKYKGRINNYLSAQGYDLEKERDGWYERIEAKKKANH